MKNNLIKFYNKRYYFDVDAMMKWCISSSNNPFKETEINEGYDTNNDGEIQMVTKVIRELKTSNSQDDTVRYDFMKVLISPFLGEIVKIDDISENFSHALLFNTLIEMGFLIEIND